MTKKRKLKTLTVSALIALATIGVGAGGTFALFTDSAETKVNVTSGTVDIQSAIAIKAAASLNADDETAVVDEESATYANGGTATVDNATGKVTLSNWTPGDTVTLGTTPTNNSNVKTKVRLKIVMTGDLASALVVEGYKGSTREVALTGKRTVVSDWKDTAEGAAIEAYDVKISFPDHDGGEVLFGTANKDNQYQGKEATIQIFYEAVQANAKLDATLEGINSKLATEEIIDGEMNHTMYDALQDLSSDQVDAIRERDYVWSQELDEFFDFASAPEEAYKYFKMYESASAVSGDYSIYADAATWDATVDLDGKGFDAGDATGITAINYTNTGAARDVVIRTNSFATTLTINAPADTVNHYGNAAIVNVEKIAGESYHENGTVGRLTVEEGHAVAESNATIFCFIDAGSDTTATVEVKSGAVVYDKNGENKGQDDVVEGTHDDCGVGHHDFGTQLVIDNHVYEVCKSCGYTLVSVVDLAGNERKVTMVDDEGEIVNTPIATYNSSATNNAGQVIEGKENPVVETPTVTNSDDATCTHNFVSTTSIEATCTQTGVKTYTCSNCGMSYTSVIPMTAHSYYDHVGAGHTADETCSVCGHVRGEYVAEVNGVQYKTLTDAIAAVPIDGTQTLITLINDDAIEGNAGWTIAATQNIVLDLNGYKLKNLVTEDKASQVINNKGTLVIKDSSDLNKDGSGTGIIFNQAKDGANLGTWPTYNYVTNIVTNTGNFTLQSGKLFVAKGSSISYCIDNQSTSYDVAVIINGGQLMNHFTATIRQFCNSTTKNNVVTINGGIIKGYNAIWMQNPNEKDNKGTLTINGGTFYTEANSYLNGGTVVEASTSIYNTSGNNHASNMYLTINGGEFFENIGWYGSTSHCTITGGTFHGYVDIYSDDSTITGGIFSDVYDAPVSSYVGYYKEDGTFYGGGSSSISWTISDWENNGYTVLNASETGHKYYYLNDYTQYIGRDDGNCKGYTMASWMRNYSYTEISDLTGYYDIISPAYRHLDDLIVSEGYKLQDNGNGTFTVVPE